MGDPTLFLLLLRAGVIGGVVAGIIVLALGWPWRAPNPTRAAIGWALGVAAALIVGSQALGLELRWPPTQNRDRFLLLVLPAAVLAECLAAFAKVPRWIAWLVRAVVAAGAGRVLLHASVYLQDEAEAGSLGWAPDEVLLWLGGLAVALLALWSLLGLRMHIAPSRSVPLALAIVCAGSAAAVMFSSSVVNGQLGIPLAGAIVGCVVASCFVSTPPQGSAPIGVGVVALFSLLVGGRFFAELTTLHAAVLFSSPLLCWLPQLPPMRKLKPWLRDDLCVLAVAIPVAIVVFQAEREHTAKSKAPGSEDDWGDFYRDMK
jgi:hypothetical protein